MEITIASCMNHCVQCDRNTEREELRLPSKHKRPKMHESNEEGSSRQ